MKMDTFEWIMQRANLNIPCTCAAVASSLEDIVELKHEKQSMDTLKRRADPFRGGAYSTLWQLAGFTYLSCQEELSMTLGLFLTLIGGTSFFAVRTYFYSYCLKAYIPQYIEAEKKYLREHREKLQRTQALTTYSK